MSPENLISPFSLMIFFPLLFLETQNFCKRIVSLEKWCYACFLHQKRKRKGGKNNFWLNYANFTCCREEFNAHVPGPRVVYGKTWHLQIRKHRGISSHFLYIGLFCLLSDTLEQWITGPKFWKLIFGTYVALYWL